MKTKIMVLLAVMITVLGLVACTTTEVQTANDQAKVEVSIDDFMNVNAISRQVEVAKDGTITVTLGSNQTTGFQWSEQAQIGDTTVLEQTGHEYIEPEAGVVGAGGKEQWTFKALKAGATTIAMEYSRPWEGGEKAEWTFNLTVTVKP